MNNNHCLRRIRYILDLSDSKMIDIFAQANQTVTRAEVSAWLKKGVFIKSSGLVLSMNPFRVEIQAPKMEVDGLHIACLIPKATTPDFDEALNAAIHTL